MYIKNISYVCIRKNFLSKYYYVDIAYKIDNVIFRKTLKSKQIFINNSFDILIIDNTISFIRIKDECIILEQNENNSINIYSESI